MRCQKMKQSEETKKYALLSALFLVLSISITYGPILYYIITGLVIAETAQKVVLTLFATSALIAGVICFIQKHRFRSPLWLLILGIYFAIDHILPLIIMVAIGTILDETILTPLHKLYKSKKQINSEIDKRVR